MFEINALIWNSWSIVHISGLRPLRTVRLFTKSACRDFSFEMACSKYGPSNEYGAVCKMGSVKIHRMGYSRSKDNQRIELGLGFMEELIS